MEFRKNKTDRGTVLDNICALIRERVGNGCVLLTGTLSANRMQAISNSLSERLDDSVKLLTEGSFLNNNSAVEGASEASAVIILEEKHISEANEIRRMLEMLNLGKTPVIGAIVA